MPTIPFYSDRMRIAKISALVYLLTLVTVTGLWFASPLLIPAYLSGAAADEGMELTITISRPGWSGLSIGHIAVKAPAFEVTMSQVNVEYSVGQLFEGRLKSIVIDNVHVRTIAPGQSESEDETTLSPLDLWAEVPVDTLQVRHLNIVDPLASVDGSLRFDQHALTLDAGVTSDLLPTAVAISGTLNATGEARLMVMQPGEPPALYLEGHPGAESISMNGTLIIQGRLLSLLSTLAIDSELTGNVTGSFSARLPISDQLKWTVQDIEAKGTVSFELAGNLPGFNGASIKGLTGFSIERAVVSLLDLATSATAASTSLDERVLHLHPETLVSLTGDASMPIAAFESPGLTGASASLSAKILVSIKDDLIINKPRLDTIVGLELKDGDLSLQSDAIRLTGQSVRLDGVNYGLEEEKLAEGSLEATLKGFDMKTLSATSTFSVSAYATHKDAYADITVPATLRISGEKLGITIGESAVIITGAGNNEVTVRAVKPVTASTDLELSAINVERTELSFDVSRLPVAGQTARLRDARLAVSRFNVKGEQLDAAATFRSRNAANAFPLEITLLAELGDNSGSFTLKGQQNVSQPLLKSELPGWRSTYDLDGGDLSLDLAGTFDESMVINASGTVALRKGLAHEDDLLAGGINGAFELTMKGTDFSIRSDRVTISDVDIGFPVTGLTFGIASDADTWQVAGFSARALGGTHTIDELLYYSKTGSADFDLKVMGLSLDQLLALEGEDIEGTGILDGTIPVRMTGNEPSVVDGQLVARPPGGKIRYLKPMPNVNPGLALATEALKDFRYTLLAADINYSPTGDLNTRVRLEGSSPNVEKGRPIHFNLNINENIPVLLESLRASEALTERIQQRLSR